MSYNEHTKKKMQTGIASYNYRANWDAIFNNKAPEIDYVGSAVNELLKEHYEYSLQTYKLLKHYGVKEEDAQVVLPRAFF